MKSLYKRNNRYVFFKLFYLLNTKEMSNTIYIDKTAKNIYQVTPCLPTDTCDLYCDTSMNCSPTSDPTKIPFKKVSTDAVFPYTNVTVTTSDKKYDVTPLPDITNLIIPPSLSEKMLKCQAGVNLSTNPQDITKCDQSATSTNPVAYLINAVTNLLPTKSSIFMDKDNIIRLEECVNTDKCDLFCPDDKNTKNNDICSTTKSAALTQGWNKTADVVSIQKSMNVYDKDYNVYKIVPLPDLSKVDPLWIKQQKILKCAQKALLDKNPFDTSTCTVATTWGADEVPYLLQDMKAPLKFISKDDNVNIVTTCEGDNCLKSEGTDVYMCPKGKDPTSGECHIVKDVKDKSVFSNIYPIRKHYISGAKKEFDREYGLTVIQDKINQRVYKQMVGYFVATLLAFYFVMMLFWTMNKIV